MVHNPGGDWHPGRGDNPKCINDCLSQSLVPRRPGRLFDQKFHDVMSVKKLVFFRVTELL